MIRPFVRSTQNLKRIACCLCWLPLVMCAVQAAQGGQADKLAAAEKLMVEAQQLDKEETKESLEQAIGKYRAAAAIYRAAGAKGREADALNSVGFNYNTLGEPRQALDYVAGALTIARAMSDRSRQAVALNNLGQIHKDLGESQKALDYFGLALPLLKSLNDADGQATTLNNIGGLYFSLGEIPKALNYLEQSLALRQASSDRGVEAITLTNIGNIYFAEGQQQKALKYYEQALPLFRAVGDRRSEAVTLSQIGQVYAYSDDLKTAVDYYGRALPLSREAGDRSGEALTLSLAATALRILGDYRQAVEFYENVLSLYRAIGDRGGEARTLFNIAVNQNDLNDLKGALGHMDEAFVILESLRADIGSQDLRSSYFATVQDYYEFYIDLLMRMHKQQPLAGFDGRALQASESARARSLLETLGEAGADIRQGVDPTLLARERALRRRLNILGQSQVKLLNRQHTPAEATGMARDLDALTTEVQQVEAQIRQASPRYAALTRPQPLSAREIQQQLLDEDTLLLEYSLGRDRSYLWAVTRDSIKSYELPKRTTVEDAAKQMYALLTNARNWSPAGSIGSKGLLSSKARQPANPVGHKAPPAATILAQMLLGPVVEQLERKRLLIVADGALQFIPFAALPIPSTSDKDVAAYRPLITEHEIVSLPSASTLAVLRREMSERQPAERTIAILADPVFTRDDVRLAATKHQSVASAPARGEQRGLALAVAQAAADSGIARANVDVPRLPGTRKEAERILALVPAAEQMHVYDFAANRAAVAHPDLGRYRYLHFATHGFLNSQHPELSGLLLSMYDQHGVARDGFLRAHEIFNLKLSADLVTLSACQTGLGKEIRGEGLVSLTRGFMYAGAARVVVSLWNVSDEGTAELMSRFYREMLKEGKRPAAALQAAQISMLREENFASPYYWSAFTLQGEWR